jgi:hypothetical protein
MVKMTYLNIAEHYLSNTQNDSSPAVSGQIAPSQGYEINEINEITPPSESQAAAPAQPSAANQSDNATPSIPQSPDVGFSDEDVRWIEVALSKHFGVPTKLYDREEFLKLEREGDKHCPTNEKPAASVQPSSASRCPPS